MKNPVGESLRLSVTGTKFVSLLNRGFEPYVATSRMFSSSHSRPFPFFPIPTLPPGVVILHFPRLADGLLPERPFKRLRLDNSPPHTRPLRDGKWPLLLQALRSILNSWLLGSWTDISTRSDLKTNFQSLGCICPLIQPFSFTIPASIQIRNESKSCLSAAHTR